MAGSTGPCPPLGLGVPGGGVGVLEVGSVGGGSRAGGLTEWVPRLCFWRKAPTFSALYVGPQKVGPPNPGGDGDGGAPRWAGDPPPPVLKINPWSCLSPPPSRLPVVQGDDAGRGGEAAAHPGRDAAPPQPHLHAGAGAGEAHQEEEGGRRGQRWAGGSIPGSKHVHHVATVEQPIHLMVCIQFGMILLRFVDT